MTLFFHITNKIHIFATDNYYYMSMLPRPDGKLNVYYNEEF